MRSHAMLSASGASRWLTCTPSARLEEELIRSTMLEDNSEEVGKTVYADEGTFAHKLAEWYIREEVFGVDISMHVKRLLESEDGELYYNEEMDGYCRDYAMFVAECLREAPNDTVLLQEERLDLIAWIPEGFGTVDVCLSGPNFLQVIDFKYGKGVPVEAYENKQMMVYALGMLSIVGLLFDVKEVVMTVYQPRIQNISSYEITTENLLRWGREVLRPGAIMAFQGIGDFIPGEHCQFCKVRSTCAANAKFNLAVANKRHDLEIITDEQVVKVLMRADAMKKWITSVEQMALEMARKGKKWPGMKLVEGRSNRKYTDEEAILKGLLDAGYDGSKLVNKKLTGITQMSKIVSKLDFKQFVEPYVHKPEGITTLVPETDARPEFDRNNAAASTFQIEDDE